SAAAAARERRRDLPAIRGRRGPAYFRSLVRSFRRPNGPAGTSGSRLLTESALNSRHPPEIERPRSPRPRGCLLLGPPQHPPRAHYTADTGVDQVLDDTLASIPQAMQFLQSHRALADQYAALLGRSIGFVAYEGGAALEGHYQSYQLVLNQASVDPRMYDIYR